MSKIVSTRAPVLTFAVACACAYGVAACDRTQNASRDPRARNLEPAALCLHDPGGTHAIDRPLRERQAAARTAQAVPSAWIAAGFAWVRKARAQSQPALYRNAGACAQVALGQAPHDAAAHGLHGIVLLDDHRFAQARDVARGVLARDPNDPLALGLLSDAELELGDLDAAIEAAQRLIDLKPDLGSYGRAAHLLWLQGDVLGAKRVYAQAIAAGRGHADREPSAWMLVQAGLLFWHEGDYAGAEAGFDAALAELRDYPPAQEGKGRVALARGDAGGAVRWFERALAQRPSVETAWLLGDAHALAGDARAAERAYARVEREGALHDPRVLAGFYATRRKNTGEAVRLARGELEQRRDLYTKAALAWALHRAGKSAEAKRWIEEALAAGTPDARLLYHGGEILIASGDSERGQALRARAVRLNPHFDPLLLEQSHARASSL